MNAKSEMGHGGSAMLDVKQVATLLNCSARHVYRLCDAGKMPRPVKLGALVRWGRKDVINWIERGCPSCEEMGGGEL